MKRYYKSVADRPIWIWLTVAAIIIVGLLWWGIPHLAKPKEAPVIDPSELTSGGEASEQLSQATTYSGEGAAGGATTSEADGAAGASRK